MDRPDISMEPSTGPAKSPAMTPWLPWTTPSATLRVPAGEPDTYGQAGHLDGAVHRPRKIASDDSMVAMDHAIGHAPRARGRTGHAWTGRTPRWSRPPAPQNRQR